MNKPVSIKDLEHDTKLLNELVEYLWILTPFDMVYGNYDKMKPLEIVG